jgi:hypothetical protein
MVTKKSVAFMYVKTVLKVPRRSDTNSKVPIKEGVPMPISYICKSIPAKNKPNKPCGAALRA